MQTLEQILRKISVDFIGTNYVLGKKINKYSQIKNIMTVLNDCIGEQ